MDKRFVRNEVVLVRRMAAFLSDLLYWQEDMKQRLQMIDNGENRLKAITEDFTKLFNEILNTTNERQRKSILTTLKDFKVTIQPALTPESQGLLISKKEAKMLIDLAQEKCKGCVETPKDAEKCPVFAAMETILPLSSYGDGLICPYSIAEWED